MKGMRVKKDRVKLNVSWGRDEAGKLRFVQACEQSGKKASDVLRQLAQKYASGEIRLETRVVSSPAPDASPPGTQHSAEVAPGVERLTREAKARARRQSS